MGNTESNVTSGVKKQAGASMQAIYKLCDLKGKICLSKENSKGVLQAVAY